jgi:hypothetical protein
MRERHHGGGVMKAVGDLPFSALPVLANLFAPTGGGQLE